MKIVKKAPLLFLGGMISLVSLGIPKMVQPKKNTADSVQTKVSTLQVPEGLEVKPFAAEPMLINPTNIDVDSKGRVWVLEAYNYRPGINGNPTNPQGDRIVILEDTNGDGQADSRKVFYQSPELNAPLGIAVLDSMVIVSQSPYIWKMFDDNRDGKADRKEVLFSGIGGDQHDHGAHAFTFGPDGKLYFNIGNEGKQLLDAKGNPVLDQDGDPIGPKKYRQGMVFRCNLDGSQVEVLGHNFRNNYEVAVDSYGALWQSDNDDDGNKGVRINAVFEHGNYGYVDEMTGEGWYVNRTNIEKEIPLRHWHLNDPGVVPNLLQTGAGSPTGMIIYEGNLLPSIFQNQMIHTDAGPNVVRSYATTPWGAGYEARINNLITSKDQWFRPADVAAAPDGSLFVADWYDPGVGGHQAGDQAKGRIYRIAPKGHAYKKTNFDLSTPELAFKALENPNLEIRFLAFQALKKMGNKAESVLENEFNTNENPRFRARAFWVLNQGSRSNEFILKAFEQANPNLKAMAIRAAKQKPFTEWSTLAAKAAKDQHASVRRELAIALRHLSGEEVNQLWASLAMRHNGTDRWYLEALGIGADGNWDERFAAYAALKPENSKGYSDVVWRARTEKALPALIELIGNTKSLAYFRALDFMPGEQKSEALFTLINGKFATDVSAQLEAVRHMKPAYIASHPEVKIVLSALLKQISGKQYLELVDYYQLKEESPRVLGMILAGTESSKAGQVVYNLPGGAALIRSKFFTGKEAEQLALIEMLRWQGKTESAQLLYEATANPKLSKAVQMQAARVIGNAYPTEEFVLDLLEKKKIATAYVPLVVESLQKAWRKSIRMKANSYLAKHQTETKKAHPAMAELINMSGDAVKGKVVFTNSCTMCHLVNNEGIDFGPKLSEIGTKLSKEGMYMSILHPNAGIGFGYETFEVKTKSGDTYQGIIVSKNETDIMLRIPGGIVKSFKTSALKSYKQLPESLMPEGLADGMSTPELVDLIEYLSTLKKK
ncbi:PVC-type heme-binding CxxCH protein [Aquirufa antheringensis]|jgi:putative membrane-bound dehydrogenase-like protein|uniref:C-type cytochrome n=1 Tax=Aquirufa antheringensis TaxID=2516559 RepID=A0A4V2IVJ6_9BACT|nr:PVC-type heme-binding CxxCH protein [Aquirufa antheringensis]MCZ2485577.1 c-type cytochrome [Aquirufa antheringensis]MCZ2486718.1 c-type cytochrome [Aquirufa antheringensis]MCZ2488501.1 c-type cytochrome [Aquirufa antheringensis]TBH71945.1 c-type cytochrome [Aquirufa antheringensis]